MDKFQVIDAFWNQFGIKAYDENTVPEGAVLPYITYEASIASFDEKIINSASLWYETYSWTEISQKAEEISNYIGGGHGVPYDGGGLWITKEAPFAQRMSDQSNEEIRRILLQVGFEFQ